MTDDALSFLDETPQPQAEAAPVVLPEPVVEEQGEPSAAPPAAPEPHRDVPLTALLDEREKRQQATREAEELRREIATLKAQSQPQPKAIDVLEDPEGYARQQQQMLQQAIMDDRLERSKYMAEERHGAQKVADVIAFFNDPQHAPKTHEFKFHPDPVGAAIRYYDEQQELTRLRSEGGLTAYEQKLREQIRAELLAEVQSGTSKPASPPPSLSSAASTGAAKAPPINGFDAAFGA